MLHSFTVSYGFNHVGDTITQFYWPSLNEIRFYQLRPDEFDKCAHGDIVAIFRIKERAYRVAPARVAALSGLTD